MKIHYSSEKQEKVLTDIRLIKKIYGRNYEKIANRLSELRVAQNLSEIPEVPPPRRHKLNGKYKDCWGIDYSKNFRIIIKPVCEFEINVLSSIVEILIVDLEDYH